MKYDEDIHKRSGDQEWVGFSGRILLIF